VQVALAKTPATARKSRPRTAQLKLAGIATVQGDHPAEERAKPAPKSRGEGKAKSEAGADSRTAANIPAATDEPAAVNDDRQQSLIAPVVNHDGEAETAAATTSSQTKIA